MSLEDDFLETIRMAREEKQSEEKAARDFAESWEALRKGAATQILRSAEKALNGSGIGGLAKLENGSDLILEAKYSPNTPRPLSFVHRLKFSPAKGKFEIVCTSSIKNFPDETFALEFLTEGAIAKKVKQFLDAVVRSI